MIVSGWVLNVGSWSSYFEHLDEGNREIQVGQVATDQAQAEEHANRHDGPHVDTTSHLNRLASVENSSPARENLGHNGREGQVVGRQDNRVTCARLALSAVIACQRNLAYGN